MTRDWTNATAYERNAIMAEAFGVEMKGHCLSAYSTNIAAAMELAEPICDGIEFSKGQGKWECLVFLNCDPRDFRAVAESMAEALCLALLYSKGVEVA